MSDRDDLSTVHIIKWLIHWEVPFVRIDRDDTFFLDTVEIKNGCEPKYIIFNDKKSIVINDIKASWYRRGRLNIHVPNRDILFNSPLDEVMEKHLKSEKQILESFFYHLINQKPHIGTFQTGGMNKLIVLQEAVTLGLTIPQTFISTTNKSSELQSKAFITKSISEGFKYHSKEEWYSQYTEKASFSSTHQKFFPSLFQEHIQKEADLRVFYLCGDFYCMAIRSQENDQTSIDFRKYDRIRPNRSVPFTLPILIKKKLNALMHLLGLQTGSIDLVMTKNEDYIFLEVNPVGQFNMTSVPCNFNLEKIIAQKLSNLAGYGI